MSSISGTAQAAASADVITFRPAPGDNHFITIFESTTLQPGEFKPGLYLDYAKNLFILKVPGGASRNVVEQLFTNHLTLGVGLLDLRWLGIEFGVDWPFATESMNALIGGKNSKGFYTGDPKADLKFRFLDRRESPIGIALTVFGQGPVGKGSRFLGNNSFTEGGSLIVERSWNQDRFLSTLNLGYLNRVGVNPAPATRVNNQVFASLGLRASIRSWDIFAEGNVAAEAAHLFVHKNQTPSEVDLGFGYRFNKIPLVAEAGGGLGLTDALGAPKFRVFTHLSYLLNEKPDKAHARREKIERNQIDLEKAADQVRECTRRKKTGCPSVVDLNKDFNAKEVHQIYAMAIVDLKEGDPQVVALQKQFSAAEWSEIVLAKEEVKVGRAAPTAPVKELVVHFAFGNTHLRDAELPVLSKAADWLSHAPNLKRVKVIGYTDPIGTDAINHRVSIERARTVIKYLKLHGLSKSLKLIAVGKGTKNPVASNKTPKGRAQNRRVIFVAVP